MTVTDEVWDDLAAIEAYYRDAAPEQVARFRQKYRATIAMIRQWPHSNEEDRPSIRHCKTPVFPYPDLYRYDCHSVISQRVVFLASQ